MELSTERFINTGFNFVVLLWAIIQNVESIQCLILEQL